MKLYYYLIALLFLASCEGVDGTGEATSFYPTQILLNNTDTVITIKDQKNLDWSFHYVNTHSEYNPPLDTAEYALLNTYHTYNKYGEESKSNIVTIESSWFRVVKVDSQTIRISVSKTSRNRKFSFDVFRGNPRQLITVWQKADPPIPN